MSEQDRARKSAGGGPVAKAGLSRHDAVKRPRTSSESKSAEPYREPPGGSPEPMDAGPAVMKAVPRRPRG